MIKLKYKVVGILAATLLCAASLTIAEQPKIDEKAAEVLKAMSDKLASAKKLRLSMKRATDSGLIERLNISETVEGHVLAVERKLDFPYLSRLGVESQNRVVRFSRPRLLFHDVEFFVQRIHKES